MPLCIYILLSFPVPMHVSLVCFFFGCLHYFWSLSMLLLMHLSMCLCVCGEVLGMKATERIWHHHILLFFFFIEVTTDQFRIQRSWGARHLQNWNLSQCLSEIRGSQQMWICIEGCYTFLPCNFFLSTLYRLQLSSFYAICCLRRSWRGFFCHFSSKN